MSDSTRLSVEDVTEAIAELIDSELGDRMTGSTRTATDATVISGSAADGAFEILIRSQRFKVRVERRDSI